MQDNVGARGRAAAHVGCPNDTMLTTNGIARHLAWPAPLASTSHCGSHVLALPLQTTLLFVLLLAIVACAASVEACSDWEGHSEEMLVCYARELWRFPVRNCSYGAERSMHVSIEPLQCRLRLLVLSSLCLPPSPPTGPPFTYRVRLNTNTHLRSPRQPEQWTSHRQWQRQFPRLSSLERRARTPRRAAGGRGQCNGPRYRQPAHRIPDAAPVKPGRKEAEPTQIQTGCKIRATQCTHVPRGRHD